VSDELLLLRQPEEGYRRLVEAQGAASRTWLRRPLGFLLVIASMVSILTAGRLTLLLFVDALVAWSFVPVLHMVAAVVTVRMLGRSRMRIGEAVDLYFMGFGPWHLWMLGFCGAALFMPSGADLWSLPLAVIAGSAAIAFAWSAWINFGFFRGAVGLAQPKAVLAVVAARAVVWGFVGVYLHVSDQLLPRLPWLARLL
jgi:hypothetical protein